MYYLWLNMSWYWSHTETIKCVGEHTWVVSFSGVSRILVRDTGRICLQKIAYFCVPPSAQSWDMPQDRERKKNREEANLHNQTSKIRTHTHTHILTLTSTPSLTQCKGSLCSPPSLFLTIFPRLKRKRTFENLPPQHG